MSRETPYPGGGELPREYSHTLDPFVALAAAATATERLKVGTGVCLVIERDPIVTAKEVATLDHISGGRFLFGVGAGWNVEEMRNHGTDPDTRFRRMRERVEAMKAIWTQDEAEYHGRHRGLRPDLVVAEAGAEAAPAGARGRAWARRCSTAWWRTATSGSRTAVKSPEELAPRIAELQRRAEAAGRERIPVTVFGAKPEVRLLERLSGGGRRRARSSTFARRRRRRCRGSSTSWRKVAAEWAG